MDQDGDEIESESNDESNCDIEESAFMGDRGDNDSVEEEDVDYIYDGWVWNKWEEIGDDDEIPGPKKDDHYNGHHGLKEGVGEKFTKILQCIFETTCMNRDFFKRLTAQLNKYARHIWCA